MLEKLVEGVCQISYDASEMGEGGKMKTSEYRQKGGKGVQNHEKNII